MYAVDLRPGEKPINGQLFVSMVSLFWQLPGNSGKQTKKRTGKVVEKLLLPFPVLL